MAIDVDDPVAALRGLAASRDWGPGEDVAAFRAALLARLEQAEAQGLSLRDALPRATADEAFWIRMNLSADLTAAMRAATSLAAAMKDSNLARIFELHGPDVGQAEADALGRLWTPGDLPKIRREIADRVVRRKAAA